MDLILYVNDMTWYMAKNCCSRPFPALEPLYQFPLLNSPGKTILGLKVKFPPNGSTPPHRHPGASLAVHVLEGRVLNKMNNEPMKIIQAGESFYEGPGCHHKISDNDSATEEAVLLATMVIDTEVLEHTLKHHGYAGLVQVDEEYK